MALVTRGVSGALISRPGDEVERDRERREDDAGREGIALEGESSGSFHLLCFDADRSM